MVAKGFPTQSPWGQDKATRTKPGTWTEVKQAEGRKGLEAKSPAGTKLGMESLRFV
jgi:hypothetical protein